MAGKTCFAGKSGFRIGWGCCFFIYPGLKEVKRILKQDSRHPIGAKRVGFILEKSVFSLMLFFTLAMVLLWGFEYIQGTHLSTMNLNTGWSDADGTTVDLPLRDYNKNNKTVRLQRTLGDSFQEERVICFYTSQANVTVTLADTILYQKVEGTGSFRQTGPASQWNVVNIPAGSNGLLLQITLDRGGYASFLWCGDLFFGSGPQIMNQMISQSMIPYVFSWVMLVLAVLMIAAYYLLRKQLRVKGLQFLGISVALYAFHAMNASRMYGIFNGMEKWGALLALGSFCLFYIPFLLYFKEHFAEQYQKPLVTMAVTLLSLEALLFVSWLIGLTDAFIVFLASLLLLLCSNTILLILSKKAKQNCLPAALLVAGAVGSFLLAFSQNNSFLYLPLNLSVVLYTFSVLTVIVKAILEDVKNKTVYQKQSEWIYNQMMTSQIKPHFMYNVLSSIRTLIKKDPDKAYKMIYDFSKYLRASIDSMGNEQLVPFREELNNIKAYLDIEQVRFAGRFEVIYDIRADEFPIPMLTVEPLVENAVKHGLRQKKEGGRITIRSYSLGGLSVVEIEDNGCGFDSGNLKQVFASSAGLNNINSRLNYFNNYELHINSQIGKGTTATILYIKEREERRN